MDKTGTVTKGVPAITDIVTAEETSEDTLMSLGAGAEAGSEHPLGRVVVHYAQNRNIPIPEAENFNAVTGKGISAYISGKRILAGNLSYLREEEVTIPETALSKAEELQSQGKTVILFASGNTLLGLFGISDPLREGIRETVSAIKSLGIKPVLITGDNEETAKRIAREAGIPEYQARMLPQDKAGVTEEYRKQNQVVVMVGDGINDAPALASADVGIAMGSGTDIAAEAGDIVLVRNDPQGIIRAINLSRGTFRKIKQNLFWASGYNLIMIPLAVMGLLHPILAEIAMAFSSVSVVANSRLLQRKSIDQKELQ